MHQDPPMAHPAPGPRGVPPQGATVQRIQARSPVPPGGRSASHLLRDGVFCASPTRDRQSGRGGQGHGQWGPGSRKEDTPGQGNGRPHTLLLVQTADLPYVIMRGRWAQDQPAGLPGGSEVRG